MSPVTKSDMQNANNQLKADILHSVPTKQDIYASLDRICDRLVAQIREQQIMSKQLYYEINNLNRRIAQLENRINTSQNQMKAVYGRY